LTAKTQEQADYDMQDSLLNVAFGTVFGGGLHTVAAGISAAARSWRGEKAPWTGLQGLDDADITLMQNLRREIDRGMDLRDVSRAIEGYSPAARRSLADVLPAADSAAARIAGESLEVRETTLRTAVSQVIHGKAVEVEPIIKSSRNSEAITVEELAPRPLTPEMRRGIDTPPVPEGHVRLYRASSPTESFDDVFDAEQLKDFRALHGRSYTTDLKVADYYRSSYGKDAVIEYADVPADRLQGREAAPGEYVLARSKSSGSRTSIPEIRATAERQASPESDITADVRASKVADTQVTQSPKGEDLELNEATLADELLSLKDSMRIAGNESLMDELAPFDEALARADEYGKAAKAAALCGLGH
jgi:hypothetical protein